MPTLDDSALPEEPNDLVRLLQDPATARARYEAAAARLFPVLQRVARRVAANVGASPDDRDELVSQAGRLVSDPQKLGQFDPAKGQFVAWLGRTLRNCQLDLCRRRERERAATKKLQRRALHASAEQIIDPVDLADPFLTHPFPPEDVQRISRWALPNRLLLLSRFGLWRNVPVELWQCWVEEANLPTPFPPDSILGATTFSEMLDILVNAYGGKKNTLIQRLNRSRKLLEDLVTIQRLRP